MLHVYSIELKNKKYFGEVTSKDFYLPINIRKITDVALFSTTENTGDLSVEPISYGSCSLSINEQEVGTFKVIRSGENSVSLQRNMIKLDRPVMVEKGSIIRFTFEEITDELQFAQDNDKLSLLTVKIFIKYE